MPLNTKYMLVVFKNNEAEDACFYDTKQQVDSYVKWMRENEWNKKKHKNNKFEVRLCQQLPYTEPKI
jgi:hypothetical protein